ncbi:MAG: bL35 family ribosomal protein [Candidatus Paceibacterota bacterium]
MANAASKTKKTILKRFRVTKNGKVMRRKMGSSHFRAKKGSSLKQSLRSDAKTNRSDVRALRQEGARIC